MNWISVKEQLPSSTEEIVLACINNEIYMGTFSACEMYRIDEDGSKKDYKKIINFLPTIWLDNNHCNECDIPGLKCGDHNNQCVDCCEKDNDFMRLGLSFNLDDITHWMPLPSKPENLDKNKDNITLLRK